MWLKEHCYKTGRKGWAFGELLAMFWWKNWKPWKENPILVEPLNQIAAWDEVECSHLLSSVELSKMEEAKVAFVRGSLFGTKIKGGMAEKWDKYVRFFHKMTNAHRRRNHLSMVKINGVWSNKESEMREQVVRDF